MDSRRIPAALALLCAALLTAACGKAPAPAPAPRAHAQPILLFNQGNFMKTSCNPARPSVILKANEAGFSRNVF